MWSNTWGDTTQSRNNSSCRCAHTGVIFSPPHHGMSTGGCSLEAIDTTGGYVTQTGVKEEDTVGLMATPEKAMDIDVTTTAQAVIVAVRGRLDTTSAPVFEQRLADVITQGATYIVVQCSELAYINSAGLRSVLISGKKLQAQQ